MYGLRVYPDGRPSKRIKPDYKVGDLVRDHMAFSSPPNSGRVGQITEAHWVEPGESAQCFYGGFLYEHNARGHALPAWTSPDSLTVEKCTVDPKTGKVRDSFGKVVGTALAPRQRNRKSKG